MAPSSDETLAAAVRRELLDDILPFWRSNSVDEQHGGFIGEMSNDLVARPDAARGLILTARLVWTFSAAYRCTSAPQDKALAIRACDCLTRDFLDPQHGGYFWEVTPHGGMIEGGKKTYGQAFCIYALSEYHRSFGTGQALQQAIDLFGLLERHAHDGKYGGYVEALSRDWQPCRDIRLSDKDMNEPKSMNNHLHLLEAYANLLRVWPDPALAGRLRALIGLFERRILNREGTHFNHFFAEDWSVRSGTYTFGHDIEGSWLLCEAAEALGDQELLVRARSIALRIARAVLEEGLDDDGGVFYEAKDGRIIDSNKEWWPQAEAVVGFYNAWQLSGETAFRDAAVRCWQFIENRMVDRVHGEWFWRVSREGVPDTSMPKVSAWKCPYHNGRCCLEILRRIEAGTSA